MKKIVSVLALTALAFGSVFADTEISLTFTQRAFISTRNNAVKKFDLGTAGDCITFTLQNERAGVLFDIDPDASNKRNGLNHGTKANTADIMDQYYGWINFLDGQLKVQSGLWLKRNVNRMKQDAGKWDSAEYEKYKLGVVSGKIAKDISNLTFVNQLDARQLALAVTASPADTDIFGTLALVDNTNGYVDNRSAGRKDDCFVGFAFEAGYKMEDMAAFNVIIKNESKNTYGFGLFADLLAVENLDVLAGFSMGIGTKDSWVGGYDADNGYDHREWGIDLRARYQFNKRVALTTMNNISCVDGAAAKTGTASDGATFSIWDMVSISAQAKDTIRLMATLEWSYADLNAARSGSLQLIPGIEIKPASNVSFLSGVVIDIEKLGFSAPADDNKTQVSSVKIPFVFHVGL
ncbi:MAG: hypothetical protein IJP62_06750 [Treponema sp.]|nr:hypothetical protein [Treponema sp.]